MTLSEVRLAGLANHFKEQNVRRIDAVNALLVIFSLIHSILFVSFPVSPHGGELVRVNGRYNVHTVGLTRK